MNRKLIDNPMSERMPENPGDFLVIIGVGSSVVSVIGGWETELVLIGLAAISGVTVAVG